MPRPALQEPGSERTFRAKLASAAGTLFKKLSEGTLKREWPPAAKPRAGNLELGPIDQFLWKGEWVDGAYRLSTGKGAVLAGLPVGKSMGVDSWIVFAASGDGAIVNGDIAVLETELSRVLRALVAVPELQIVSIHIHLTRETPRVLFLHFWGHGPVDRLALGVKNALKEEKSFRGST